MTSTPYSRRGFLGSGAALAGAGALGALPWRARAAGRPN